MSSETRHFQAPLLLPYKGREPGCHTEVGRWLCRLQSTSRRAHVRITQRAGFPLASSQLRPEKRKEENLPPPGDAAVGTPFRRPRPRPAVPGCGALPGNFCPASLRCGGAGRGQGQPKAAAPRSRRGTPRRTNSSPLAGLRAPRPTRGPDLQLPRRVVRKDASRSQAPQRLSCGAVALRGVQRAAAARGPANSPAAEFRKPPPPQRSGRRLRPRRAPGAAPAVKPWGQGWRSGPKPEASSPERPQPGLRPFPPAAASAPALPAVLGARPPGGRGLGRRPGPRAPGGAGEGRCTSTHLEPQDLGR